MRTRDDLSSGHWDPRPPHSASLAVVPLARTSHVVAVPLACALPHHVPWAPMRRALRQCHPRVANELDADGSFGLDRCSVRGWRGSRPRASVPACSTGPSLASSAIPKSLKGSLSMGSTGA